MSSALNLVYLILYSSLGFVPGLAVDSVFDRNNPRVDIGSFSQQKFLYPRESETRTKISLDGVYDFCLGKNDTSEHWYGSTLAVHCPKMLRMPVPSSYNDIAPMTELRDFVGWAWYQRSFYCPRMLDSQLVWLRFESVNYEAKVWIDEELVGHHVGGHLPFTIKVDKCSSVYYSEGFQKLRLTVAVSNILTQTTIPGGTVEDNNLVEQGNFGTHKFVPDFDFFNYAGILRPVSLNVVPQVFISDLELYTEYRINKDSSIDGILHYNASVDTNHLINQFSDTLDDVVKFNLELHVTLVDPIDNHVKAHDTIQRHFERHFSDDKFLFIIGGSVLVKNITLWQPFDSTKHLIEYQAQLYNINTEIDGHWTQGKVSTSIHDSYETRVGFRTISSTGNRLMINGQKVYLKGFGKHEEQIIRGRSLDLATLTHDIYLIKWTGANVIRTSHYPYSEEFFDETDANGILVIGESPAVGLRAFRHERLELHKRIMSEMIERDKNRPSLVLWSIANEPRSDLIESEPYFKDLVADVRSKMSLSIALGRQLTAAIAQGVEPDRLGKLLDIVMVNRYFGWYENAGDTQMIHESVVKDMQKWYKKYGKPMIMSEYGADTIAGLHSVPACLYSEEYQTELLAQYHKAFDDLIRDKEEFFIGEMIWVFADFQTPQELRRVGGNKKGIFTRDRQPKAGAHLMRHRYRHLGSGSNYKQE